MIATSNNSYQYECCNKTNNNNNIRTTNQQLCKWFHVNISERKCNELLLKFIFPHWSNNISILKKIYRIGTFIGLLLMCLSCIVLIFSSLYIVYQVVIGFYFVLYTTDGKTIKTSIKSSTAMSSTIFTPLIPGINLPIADVPLLLLVLAFSLVIHELGHAITAHLNHVRTTEAGLFIIGIFPAAYCTIDNNDMKHLHFWNRLDIYFGGIVNNLITACITFLFITSILNVIIGMFYIPGLFIVSFNHKNLLDDNSNNVNMITSKFKIGDEIKEFNSIPINNKIVWYQEIMKYIYHNDLINQYDNHTKLPLSQLQTLDHNGFTIKVKRDDDIILIDGKSLQNINKNIDIAMIYNTLNFIEFKFMTSTIGRRGGGEGRSKNKNTSSSSSMQDNKGYIHPISYIPSMARHVCIFVIMINTSLAIINIFPIYHFDGMHIIPIVLLLSFPTTYYRNDSKRRLKYDTHRILKYGFRMFVLNVFFACLSFVL